jgi:hypothetical protein
MIRVLCRCWQTANPTTKPLYLRRLQQRSSSPSCHPTINPGRDRTQMSTSCFHGPGAARRRGRDE